MRHQVMILHRPQNLLPSHPIVSDLIDNIGFRPDASHFTLLGVNDTGAFAAWTRSTGALTWRPRPGGMRRMA
jgi:hypothetical protein